MRGAFFSLGLRGAGLILGNRAVAQELIDEYQACERADYIVSLSRLVAGRSANFVSRIMAHRDKKESGSERGTGIDRGRFRWWTCTSSPPRSILYNSYLFAYSSSRSQRPNKMN